jgi:hypothetical protein
MVFVAQYSATVPSLDQRVEAWLLSPLLIVLFLMILIKSVLESPVIYAGLLLVFVALTLRKRLAVPVRAAGREAIRKTEQNDRSEGNRWIHFVGSLTLFIIFVGTAAVIFEIVRASPDAATDVYNTVQDFVDPKHDGDDPLNIEQRAIVERYSDRDGKIRLLSLVQDERFIESQIAKHKRDRRWLYVQFVVQHFGKVYALGQKQLSRHINEGWRHLYEETKARAAENPSPTPE